MKIIMEVAEFLENFREGSTFWFVRPKNEEPYFEIHGPMIIKNFSANKFYVFFYKSGLDIHMSDCMSVSELLDRFKGCFRSYEEALKYGQLKREVFEMLKPGGVKRNLEDWQKLWERRNEKEIPIEFKTEQETRFVPVKTVIVAGPTLPASSPG